MPGSDVHDMTYYSKCMVGGILSCGITHTVMCPLDIVKCRKQVRTNLITYSWILIIHHDIHLANLNYRPTPNSTRALEMVSAQFTEPKE